MNQQKAASGSSTSSQLAPVIDDCTDCCGGSSAGNDGDEDRESDGEQGGQQPEDDGDTPDSDDRESDSQDSTSDVDDQPSWDAKCDKVLPEYPQVIQVMGSTRETGYERTLEDIQERMRLNQHVPVQLVFEPTNPMDCNAVVVQAWASCGEWQSVDCCGGSSAGNDGDEDRESDGEQGGEQPEDDGDTPDSDDSERDFQDSTSDVDDQPSGDATCDKVLPEYPHVIRVMGSTRETRYEKTLEDIQERMRLNLSNWYLNLRTLWTAML